MPKAFWWFAALWVIVAVGSGPLVIELIDRAGGGVHVPGISVTGSELLLIAVLALAGPLGGAVVARRRARSAKPGKPGQEGIRAAR